MTSVIIEPVPISSGVFAPYGDVIGPDRRDAEEMNDQRFSRYDNLARIDIDQRNAGNTAIGLSRCLEATMLPYRFDLIESHPLGSQAFIPLNGQRMIVVVGKAGPVPGARDLRAFMTEPGQGINYLRGTWHMPLIALAEGQEFLIVDRMGPNSNYVEHRFSEPLVLNAPK